MSATITATQQAVRLLARIDKRLTGHYGGDIFFYRRDARNLRTVLGLAIQQLGIPQCDTCGAPSPKGNICGDCDPVVWADPAPETPTALGAALAGLKPAPTQHPEEG